VCLPNVFLFFFFKCLVGARTIKGGEDEEQRLFEKGATPPLPNKEGQGAGPAWGYSVLMATPEAKRQRVSDDADLISIKSADSKASEATVVPPTTPSKPQRPARSFGDALANSKAKQSRQMVVIDPDSFRSNDEQPKVWGNGIPNYPKTKSEFYGAGAKALVPNHQVGIISYMKFAAFAECPACLERGSYRMSTWTLKCRPHPQMRCYGKTARGKHCNTNLSVTQLYERHSKHLASAGRLEKVYQFTRTNAARVEPSVGTSTDAGPDAPDADTSRSPAGANEKEDGDVCGTQGASPVSLQLELEAVISGGNVSVEAMITLLKKAIDELEKAKVRPVPTAAPAKPSSWADVTAQGPTKAATQPRRHHFVPLDKMEEGHALRLLRGEHPTRKARKVPTEDAPFVCFVGIRARPIREVKALLEKKRDTKKLVPQHPFLRREKNGGPAT
jgi:hypothetical protein